MQNNTQDTSGAALVIALILTLILGAGVLIWALSLDQEREAMAKRGQAIESEVDAAEAAKADLQFEIVGLKANEREKLSQVSALTRERERLSRNLDHSESSLAQERSLRLAAVADARLATNPRLALKLAHEAILAAPTAAARSALLAAILADREIASFDKVKDFTTSKIGNLLALRTETEVLIVDARSGQVQKRLPSENPDGLMAFSANDQQLVVITTLIRGLIIELETFTEVASFEVDSVITGLAFSPAGTEVLVATTDRAAWLFDLKTGKRKTVYVGHEGAVSLAVFSDEQTVATFGADNTLRFFEAESGEKLREIGGTGVFFLTKPLLAPQAKRLLLIDNGNQHVDVVNVELGEIEFSAAISSIYGLDPSGTKLLWAEAPDYRKIKSLDLGGDGESVDFHDLTEGRVLQLVEGGYLVRLGNIVSYSAFDASTVNLNDERKLEVCSTQENRFEVSPLGALMASRPQDLRLVREDGNSFTIPLGGRPSRKYAATAADEVMVVLAQDGQLSLFSAAATSPNLFATTTTAVEKPLRARSYVSPQSALITLCDQNGVARLFDARSGEEKLRISRPGQMVVAAAYDDASELLALGLTSAARTPDETPTATTEKAATAPNFLVFDTKSAELIHESALANLHFLPIGGATLDLSPDGQLLSLQSAGSVFIQTWRDNSLSHRFWHWDANQSLYFSRSGHLVFVGGGSPCVYDPFTGAVKRAIQTPNDCIKSELTADEKHIVTLESDGSLRSWSVEDGSIINYFGGREDRISTFSLGSNPNLIAAVGVDGSCRLYDIKAAKQLERWMTVEAAEGITFSSSSQHVAVLQSGHESLEICRVEDRETVLQLRGVGVVAVEVLDEQEVIFLTDHLGRVTRTPLNPMKLRSDRELPRLSAEDRQRFLLPELGSDD